VVLALPEAGGRVGGPLGKSFGTKRIGRAAEVAGAGIMLAVFLFLALLA
jgi:hypothetical protein